MPRKNYAANSFSSFKKIAIGFIVLALVLLIFIIYFSFAKATITLFVDQEPKTLSSDLVVTALDSKESGDLTGKFISQEIEISQDFTVSNYKEELGVAEGRVRIINKHTRNQPLVKTTRFLSPEGLLFRLKKYVVVPAGGEVVADVYADKKGSKYNIGPSRFTIPGLPASLQQKIYGISDKPMAGGVKKVGILTQQDVDAASKMFLENLNKNIESKLFTQPKKNGPKDKTGESNSDIKLVKGRILEKKLSNKVGEKVGSFSITAKVLAQAVVVNYDELLAKAKKAYMQKLAGQSPTISWILDKFDYSLEDINMENKSARVKTTLVAKIRDEFDVSKFDKTEISGFDRKGVEYYFSQYPSIKKVKVEFWPFWVKSVPALADRIKIIVQ